MKTFIHNRIENYSNKTIHKTNDETNLVTIIDFISNKKSGRHELLLHSSLFTHEPVQIKTTDNKLILVIDEFIDSKQNKQISQYNWERYCYHSYVRLHNISFLLPGENFFLVKSVLISENFLLKIILTQMHIH